MPFILITAGFPGSGKSTLSKEIADKLGFIHLIGDKIRKNISNGAPTHSHQETIEVLSVLDQAAIESLDKGKSVICDMNYIKQEGRARYYDMAKNHNATAVTLWFDCPLEVALERNKKRSPQTDAYYNDTPAEAVQRMYHFREPLADWEHPIIIDCHLPLEEQVVKVGEYLQDVSS